MDNIKPTPQANPANVNGGKTVAENTAAKEAELNEPYLDALYPMASTAS